MIEGLYSTLLGFQGFPPLSLHKELVNKGVTKLISAHPGVKGHDGVEVKRSKEGNRASTYTIHLIQKDHPL